MVTKDLVSEDSQENWVGAAGPSVIGGSAIVAQVERARTGQQVATGYEKHHWALYDDDGNPGLEGYAVWESARFAEDGDCEDLFESALMSPLGDLGEAVFGATKVRYTGHPEWDIG
ncbi:hypothetical protein AWN90_42030 [Nocardia terpenica]|uniref:Uncharacterized protein n=1 Tax=Nocardia terpenica TaxID=455432 RepID=A0A164K6R5_9NOCA|nr:hypothetical protein AWN90_42030 [Nocardia terpenica]